MNEWIDVNDRLPDQTIDANTVTRFEVIDHTARNSLRALVRHGVSVELMYQDDGRTLKVVLKDSSIANTPLITA